MPYPSRSSAEAGGRPICSSAASQRERRPRANRAFTLVEMLVAALLLAIGVVGALSTVSSATHASAVADNIHTAVLLAQKHMAEIEMQPDTITGGDQQGDFGADYPGFRWQQSIEATDYQNLFKVTVTVRWGTTNSPQQHAITTFLRNDQNQQGQSGSSGTSGPGLGGGGGG